MHERGFARIVGILKNVLTVILHLHTIRNQGSILYVISVIIKPHFIHLVQSVREIRLSEYERESEKLNQI